MLITSRLYDEMYCVKDRQIVEFTSGCCGGTQVPIMKYQIVCIIVLRESSVIIQFGVLNDFC